MGSGMRIELGALRLQEADWRRWWPFHSTTQLQGYLILVLLVLVAGGALAQWMWGLRIIDAAAVAGAFAGTLPSIYLARPVRFTVRGADRATAFAVLEARLALLSCERVDGTGPVQVYRPASSRWPLWREPDVCLDRDGQALTVRGHRDIVRGLHAFLQNR